MGVFGTADYVVFAASLVLSGGIGLYYAISQRRHDTVSSFFTADRRLQVVPLTISLVVSVVSAVTLLGLPAEMYSYGSQYFFNIGSGLGMVLTAVVFVPLLHPLKLTSMFEYLEHRFQSKAVRITGSVMEILALLLYGGTALFAPATALAGVTHFPTWATALLLGLLVTCYTALGGIRAVIWSDVLQAFIMVTGIFTVVIKGIIDVGGLQEVISVNNHAGRLNFYDFDPDPRARHSFWGLTVGFMFGGLSFYGASQFTFQRITAAKTLRDAKMTIWLNIPIFYTFHILLCLLGLVIYTYYSNQQCDPLLSKRIQSSNQLLPLFVKDVLGHFPGLSGLFVAALTSSALSTISSVINSLSALIWEDFLKARLQQLSEARATLVTKFLVFICGSIIICLTFLAANFGPHIFQVCFAFLGASGGPQLGMLLLAAIFPRANAKGAIVGCIVGVALTTWITAGAYITKSFTPPLPGTTIVGCYDNHTDLNQTLMSVTQPSITMISDATDSYNTSYNPISNVTAIGGLGGGLQELYKVSYTWYTAIGAITCVLVGLVTSLFTGKEGSTEATSSLVMPWWHNLMSLWNRMMHKSSKDTKQMDNCNGEDIKLRDADSAFDIVQQQDC